MKKNNIKKKIFIIFLIIIAFILFYNSNSYAGTQKWNSLDYNVQVNTDGTMNVIETWDIYIENTNLLTETFDIDQTKYGKISDAKVSIIENGIETFLIKSNEKKENIAPGYYYALETDSQKFELAWNVGLENSSDTRTFKIYYKVDDVVKVYTDCTELYWNFLGKENKISGKNITGTIYLPKKVSNIQKLRIWAHGELEGNIEKYSTDTIKFNLPSISSGSILEVRIVTEENIYEIANNYYTKQNLNSIISEEQNLLFETTTQKEFERKRIFIWIVLNCLILLFFIDKIKKYIRLGKNIKREYAYENYDIKYFKEIPDELNNTPARALYIYNFIVKKKLFDISKVFSATLLDFALKDLIEFETIDADNIRITLKNKDDKEELSKDIKLKDDERVIYDILLDAMGSKGTITTEDFKEYSKKNYKYVCNSLDSIVSLVKKYEKDEGKIDLSRKKKLKKIKIKFYIYITLFLITTFSPILIILPVIPASLLICSLSIRKITKKICILSEKGHKESIEWDGLIRYMKEYNMLIEKKDADIVLLEKFLIYATVFGISKGLIKQLKESHKEIFYEDSNDYYRYSSGLTRYGFWYLVCDNDFLENGIEVLNNSVETICNAAYLSNKKSPLMRKKKNL